MRSINGPAVILAEISGKRGLLQKGSNAGSRVCHMIGRFRSILFVFFFQGSLAIVIMTDGTKNAITVSLGLNARIRMLLKSAVKVR